MNCFVISFTILILFAFSANAKEKVTFADTVTISVKRPFSKDRKEDRATIYQKCVELGELPAEKVKAHPSSVFFPGSVSGSAPRITKVVKVSHTTIPGHLWDIAGKLRYSGAMAPVMYSTGLYAAPGEVITLTIPDELKGKASVQIGCHSDNLNNWVAGGEDWRRMPLIVNSRELKEKKNTIANAFGGLIYIIASPTAKSFSGDIKIENGIAAPYFVLGKTTAKEWSEMIRNIAVPWGELEANGIILTISSESIKQITNPEEKAETWDIIVGACYDLAQIPTPFYRKQRIVSDVHIGGGFMHSGYPIMAHHCPERKMESESIISDPDKLMQPSNGGANWGFFHEIGHNMQNVTDWVFSGTTEVSVNFFSIYIFDQVLRGRDNAHSGISMKETRNMMDKYFAGGASFEEWQKNPFLGLVLFRQIQADFGWDAFKKVFRRFNEEHDVATASPQEQRDRRARGESANQKKIDDLVIYFSDATQRNMMPFFVAWGIPVSEIVKPAVQKYPEWMPYNFPPRLK